MRISKSVSIGLIIAACFLAYFNTLSAGFVWDDFLLIVQNPYVKSFKFTPDFFTHDLWKVGPQAINSGYYRPLFPLSFIVDYFFWGNNPSGFHLTNLLLHLLVSVSFFLLLDALTGNRAVSFTAALLFSVHPVHTESVSFISGRVDLLALAFLLLSLIFFLRSISLKRRLNYYAALALFFAALLTKEIAVTLPFIVILLDYLFLNKADLKGVIRNIPRLHLGFFLVLGVYLVMRLKFLGAISPLPEAGYALNFTSGTTHFWRLFTVLKNIALYARILVFPYNLKADYFFPASNSPFHREVVAGIILVLLAVIPAIRNAKKQPLLSFAIAWLFISFLPVSNILPVGNIFAERYMYMPSAGFCIAAGFFFSWLLQKNLKTSYLNWKVSLYLLFILLIAALARVSFERNKVWRDDFSLWQETVKAVPGNPRAHCNLARVYSAMNLPDLALGEVKTSLALYPGYCEALNLLGNIYLKKGLSDEAIKAYKIAIGIRPDMAGVYNSLAAAYGTKGQYTESIAAAGMALKYNPYFNDARYNMAVSYANSGYPRESIRMYEDYLSVSPDQTYAHVAVGKLYYEQGDFPDARRHWQEALRISRDYAPAIEALKLLDKK